MGSYEQFPLTDDEALVLGDRSMCIEDRVLADSPELETEFGTDRVEAFQVPGGDAFYPIAEDIIHEADKPGSVTNDIKSGLSRTFRKFSDRGKMPAVHEDDHGPEDDYSGCGYLGKSKNIFISALERVNEIADELEEARPGSITEQDRQRMRQLAEAGARLVERGYISVTGPELVRFAVNDLGIKVHLWKYTGQHVGSKLRINGILDGATQDNRLAHEQGEPGFGLDAAHAARVGKEELGLEGHDVELLAKLHAKAAVYVLANSTEHEERA